MTELQIKIQDGVRKLAKRLKIDVPTLLANIRTDNQRISSQELNQSIYNPISKSSHDFGAPLQRKKIRPHNA